MRTCSLVLALLSILVCCAPLSRAQTHEYHGQLLWITQRSYHQLNDYLKENIVSDRPEVNFRCAHNLLARGNHTFGPALELFVKLGELKELYSCDEVDIEWLDKNQEALIGMNKQERVSVIFNLICRLHAIRCQEDYEHNFAMQRTEWELDQQNKIDNVMMPFIWQIQQQQELLIKHAQKDKRQRELSQHTTNKAAGLERSPLSKANKKNNRSSSSTSKPRRTTRPLISSSDDTAAQSNATWSPVSDLLIDPDDRSANGAAQFDTQQEQSHAGMKRPRKQQVAEQTFRRLNIEITKRMILSNKYHIDRVKGSKLISSTLIELAKQNHIEFLIKNELDRKREKAVIQRFIRQQVEQPCERFHAHFASVFPVARFDLKYNARPSSRNEEFYKSFAQYELCESFMIQKSMLIEKITNFGLDEIVHQQNLRSI